MRRTKIIALATGGLFAASLLGGCDLGGSEPPPVDIPDQICDFLPPDLAEQLGCDSFSLIK